MEKSIQTHACCIRNSSRMLAKKARAIVYHRGAFCCCVIYELLRSMSKRDGKQEIVFDETASHSVKIRLLVSLLRRDWL